MTKNEKFERRLRDVAKELHRPMDPPPALLQRVLGAREAGKRYDLFADNIAPARYLARRLAAAAVVVLAVGTYIGVQARDTGLYGGECMMTREMRSIMGAGLFVATACAQDAQHLPVEPPVTAGQLDAAAIEPGTWTYEWAHIEDGLHRSVSAEMTLRLEPVEGEDSWRLVATMDNRYVSQTDTTVFDRANLQPRWQRAYVKTKSVAALMFDRRWEPGRVVGERRLANGNYGNVEIELARDGTTLGDLNHLLIWFQAIALDRDWSGSVGFLDWSGNPGVVAVDFNVIGEADVSGPNGVVAAWVLSDSGADRRGRLYVEKETGRLLRFELRQNKVLTNEIVLVGWTALAR